MGTQGSKGLSRQVEARRANEKQIPQEYKTCFNQYGSNSNFLNELLDENPKMGPNITKFFPNANTDYQQFTQIALFLRKFDIKARKSAFAIHNAPKTNLLDRFFMLVRGIQKWQILQQTRMDNQQLEDLFMEFMKLFINNPQKGWFTKFKKYLGLDNSKETLSMKEFSARVIEAFPLVNKYMRDYTTNKFRDMKKSELFLSNFNSGIIQQDAVILALKVPEMAGKEIKQLYSSDTAGLSFHAYGQRLIGYNGPWLLLIENFDKQVYKFGSFQTGPVLDIIDYQGDLRGFMFSIEPNIRFMTTDKGQQGSHYFFINTIDQKISKRRKGIGFGGDKQKDNCKLWIDQDLDKSKVFNGNDPTYGYGALANPMSTDLCIRKMQIWGLGTKYDLEKQTQYWQQREDQALKRRKVNKKQFIDGNATLMFEKTFAHRDQVVGDIERTKKKEED